MKLKYMIKIRGRLLRPQQEKFPIGIELEVGPLCSLSMADKTIACKNLPRRVDAPPLDLIMKMVRRRVHKRRHKILEQSQQIRSERFERPNQK